MDRKKNLLDKIGALIPGYRGYSERDGRRDTDKITRESICLNLNEIEENELEEIYKIDLEIKNEIKNFNQKKGSENIEELEIFIDKCNDFLLKRKLFLNKFK